MRGDGLVRALTRRLPPDRVRWGPADRIAYSYDASYQTGIPEVVVFPRSVDEVAAVVQVAGEAKVPLFPRGAGTGLAGGSVPEGGIAVVLTQMNRIREIDVPNMQAVVEAGVVTARLQQAAAAQGLWYPPDPGSASVATIGGNIATNAGGARSFTYGTTGQYVLGLKAVLADGAILETGGRTTKFATGYDLKSLLIGSEGTLGIVVEARLRLVPPPAAAATLRASFPDYGSLGGAIAALAGSPARPTSIEFVDPSCLEVVRRLGGVDLPAAAGGVLLCEILGHPADVRSRGETLATLVRSAGGEAEVAEGEAQRPFWQVREALGPAVARIKPTKISEDATVPIRAIPAFLEDLAAVRRHHRVELLVFGHAGDGNLHPNIVCNAADPEEMARVGAAIDAIFTAALRHGGTLTGEHGIGSLKLPYLKLALDPVALEVHRRVKRALDPDNLLNPGKAILTEVETGADPGQSTAG